MLIRRLGGDAVRLAVLVGEGEQSTRRPLAVAVELDVVFDLHEAPAR
jgi:hypothetical protein